MPWVEDGLGVSRFVSSKPPTNTTDPPKKDIDLGGCERYLKAAVQVTVIICIIVILIVSTYKYITWMFE